VISSGKSIWIVDEPFAGLDSESILELKEIMLNHIEGGGTVILTNHQDKIDASKKIVLGKENE
jgi:ABC-type transport system involved in cytochrome c biogenesis ATPase subunit